MLVYISGKKPSYIIKYTLVYLKPELSYVILIN